MRDIKDLSIEMLSKSLNTLSKNFSGLQPKEIVMVYLIEQGYADISIEDFGIIYAEESGFYRSTPERKPYMLHLEVQKPEAFSFG